MSSYTENLKILTKPNFCFLSLISFMFSHTSIFSLTFPFFSQECAYSLFIKSIFVTNWRLVWPFWFHTQHQSHRKGPDASVSYFLLFFPNHLCPLVWVRPVPQAQGMRWGLRKRWLHWLQLEWLRFGTSGNDTRKTMSSLASLHRGYFVSLLLSL